MSAYSVTGVGLGSANKPTVRDLAILSNGPAIVFAGQLEGTGDSGSPPSSPPSNDFYSVTFPYPLVEGADNYVVILTAVGSVSAQVVEKIEDENGSFTGFTATTSDGGLLMYVVVSVGIRPEVGG